VKIHEGECRFGITLALKLGNGGTMMQRMSVTTAENQAFILRAVSPPKSLLVIEDDLSSVQFINNVVDEQYHNLEWEYVSSGEQAMELIQRRANFRGQDPYSLVITDMFLQNEATGFDVWTECQRLFPDMPFVFMSKLSFEQYLGIFDGFRNRPMYLPKPLTALQCRSVLEEYF
jgi:hypothetical protein